MSFGEKDLVENYIINKLIKQGWKYIPSDELERDSYEEPLLTPSLIRALRKINKDIREEEIKQVLNALKFTGTGPEGSKRILNYYKWGISMKIQRERIVQRIRLFDYENLENNEFIVSNQVTHKGKETKRMDIILYVNGIPLVNIECKNPTDIAQSWEDAYLQIKEYEKAVPELYKYIQIGVAAEAVAKYFPIVPWLEPEEVKIYEWREEGKDSIDSTIEMLKPETLLDLIKNFLFYRIEHGNATKVIARYMQYRAANKIVKRVLANLEGIEDKNKGLIWHWQGSGKTLTMIFAANKLYQHEKLENPTIFFIVDRIELEGQLYNEMNALDITPPEPISSIAELKEVLRHDNYRGKRGIFTLLIHKFQPRELKELQQELEQLSEKQETIMTRRNVIAFIDEGHRTQYGILAAQMRNILRNAFFFAFTGTPISKRGRDTYLEFSYPPEELYLDEYFITNSIEDGYTVKITYQPRLEHLHLKKDLLETFLETELEELPEEIRGGVEEKIKRKLNTIKVILENQNRISEIAKDIAKHFKEEIDGKFKAIVVAASRKACVIYKRELDKHLPRGYTEIVMTFNRNDPAIIKEYERELKERYQWKDHEDIRKEIIERFKEEENPRILIVTDMLLTGFDAPILQTMYLDKPLKEHRLLQAIARTNRPYKDLKECGLIIDYVGILKNLEKAFRMYSKSDIRPAIHDLSDIRKEFDEDVNQTVELVGGIPAKWNRETLLEAIETITTDPKKEKLFTKNYRKIRRLFQLLGPDKIKLDKLREYKWLTAIYNYYLSQVKQGEESKRYVEKYFDKTLRYIHRSTEIQNLERGLPTITFDENYMRNLEEKVKSKREKAANILFTLNRFVLTDRSATPVYETIVEKVERLIRMWHTKTKDYERIYQEGVKILNEMKHLQERQKELKLGNLEYSILLTLEKKLGRRSEILDDAKKLSETIKQQIFPGWSLQTTARKKVEAIIRKFVRRYVKKAGLTLTDVDELYDELVRNVKRYAA
ncbi:HsdR family type I site-specific deoxyribonuclease [Candidatus Bathyarchaeota archaeon]|nr:HsdR family type I site-specific deoxyribonuclease [Candidatus Bathyarchaeota archaeon]